MREPMSSQALAHQVKFKYFHAQRMQRETSAGAEVHQPSVAIDHDRIYGAQVTKGNRAATCGCV